MAIWTGFFVLAMPLMYLMFCKDTEYRIMFIISQLIFVVAYTGKMALAHRWIPGGLEVTLYFLTGTFAESFERAMQLLPSLIIVSKVIPKGIESSMITFASVIINLN